MTRHERRHAPPADRDDAPQPTLDERMTEVWPEGSDELRGLTAGCWLALRAVAREEGDR